MSCLRHGGLAGVKPIIAESHPVADMRRKFGNPRSLAYVLDVGEGEMLRGRDHAEEVRAVHCRDCAADCTRDMVVSGIYVRYQRSQKVERGVIRDLFYHPHIVGNLIDGDMPGTFYHAHYARILRTLCEFAEIEVFHGFGAFSRVNDRTGAHAVAERDDDVILRENLQKVVILFVERVFFAALYHHGGVKRPSP